MEPDAVSWNVNDGNAMAICMYDDTRASDDPRWALLDFLESAYRAGATRAAWDIDDLAPA